MFSIESRNISHTVHYLVVKSIKWLIHKYGTFLLYRSKWGMDSIVENGCCARQVRCGAISCWQSEAEVGCLADLMALGSMSALGPMGPQRLRKAFWGGTACWIFHVWTQRYGSLPRSLSSAWCSLDMWPALLTITVAGHSTPPVTRLVCCPPSGTALLGQQPAD